MCDEVELYALSALSEDERESFERHLATCSHCQDELASYSAVLAALTEDLTPVKPPARLKMDVLALTVEDQEKGEAPADGASVSELAPVLRPRFGRIASMGVAAAAVAAAFVFGSLVSLDGAGEDGRGSSVAATIQEPSMVLDTVRAAADSSSVSKKLPNGAAVSVAYSPTLEQAVVASEDMEALSDREVYQVWIENGSGEFIPVGDFTQTKDNLLVLEEVVADAQAVGITLEPKPGAESPSSAPVAYLEI